MINAFWYRSLRWAERVGRDERGDAIITWVVLAVGLAAAAAAVVAILRPALENAAHYMVTLISGG